MEQFTDDGSMIGTESYHWRIRKLDNGNYQIFDNFPYLKRYYNECLYLYTYYNLDEVNNLEKREFINISDAFEAFKSINGLE